MASSRVGAMTTTAGDAPPPEEEEMSSLQGWHFSPRYY
jgi:hypothetical protein